jgi:hypothetical protein
VEIQAGSLVLVNFVINNFYSLRISDFDAAEVILPDFIPVNLSLGGHQNVDPTLVAVVDVVFNEGATSIVAHVNPTASSPIDVIVLCQEASSLACHHDSTTYGTTNARFDEFSVRARIAEDDCATL